MATNSRYDFSKKNEPDGGVRQKALSLVQKLKTLTGSAGKISFAESSTIEILCGRLLDDCNGFVNLKREAKDAYNPLMTYWFEFKKKYDANFRKYLCDQKCSDIKDVADISLVLCGYLFDPKYQPKI